MHRDFAVLLGWADATALPMEVLRQPKASSTFTTKSHFELFCLIQSTFSGEEALHVERNRTLWNPVVNASIATVDKRRIDEGTAQYTSTMRPSQVYLKEDGACVWIEKRKALLDIWLEWAAALLHLDGASDDKLMMSCSEHRFLVTEKHFVPQCGHGHSKLSLLTYRRPRFFMVAAAEDQASVFVCSGSQLYIFNSAAVIA